MGGRRGSKKHRVHVCVITVRFLIRGKKGNVIEGWTHNDCSCDGMRLHYFVTKEVIIEEGTDPIISYQFVCRFLFFFFLV